MGRKPDAATMGSLAATVIASVVTTVPAFHVPLPPGTQLQEAGRPAHHSGAFFGRDPPVVMIPRLRPTTLVEARRGSALHARWRFWRRNKENQEEDDPATPTAAAAAATGAGAGAGAGTAAAPVAGGSENRAVGSSSSSSGEEDKEENTAEEVAAAPVKPPTLQDSPTPPPPPTPPAPTPLTPLSAIVGTVEAEATTATTPAAAPAVAASSGAASTAPSSKAEAAPVADADAASTAAVALSSNAAAGVGGETQAGGGLGAGAGGGARVGAGSGVVADASAATTPRRRVVGKKSMAAARAAVEVMDRIRDEELRREGGGAVGGWGWGASSRRGAKTTAGAMLNICVSQNMTEAAGMSKLQNFLYALASTPMMTVDETMLTTQGEIVQRIEQKELNETLLPEAGGQAEKTALWTYVNDDEEGGPRSIYEDDLLKEFGQRAPLVAQEVDAVLLSKPDSTAFSRELLSGFERWVNATTTDMSPPLENFLFDADEFEMSTAFYEVRRVFEDAGAEDGGARQISKQLQANAVGSKYFKGLGNPTSMGIVPDNVVNRFKDEVLTGFASVKDHATAACGVRLLRCRPSNSSMTPAEISRTVKDRLAATGLNKQLAVFLTEDEVLDESLIATRARVARKAETIDTMSPMEVADLLLGSLGEDNSFLFVLVPAETRPQEETLLGEQGATALAFGAPITLCAFLGEAFDGSPVEVASKTVDGDVQLLTQVGVLGLTIAGLLLARDLGRSAAARRVGVELGEPLALPCFDTGVLARRISLASYPSNSENLFDIVLAGPVVGLATSVVTLLVGLQMTAAAGPDALAGFPSLPSSILQSSSFVGSLVDSFLHTNLGAQDLAAERISMHPLAVGGAVAMLWNAATVLPLQGSDGKTAIDTLKPNLPFAGIASFLAVTFVAMQILGGGGDFLFSALATSFVAYPNAIPIIREDNVTPVRSPGRLLLAFLVALLSLIILTPMTLSSFLATGAIGADTGAGAESVAAGFGMGGIGFGGIL